MIFDSVNRKSAETQFILTDDRLYYATRAWLKWLQGLFSTREPGKWKWSQNETETEILIYDHHPTGTQKTNKRPFITSTRGMAQMVGVSRDQRKDQDPLGEDFTVSDILITSIQLTCCAREGVEAQELAYLVFRLIPVFKPSIMKIGRIHHIDNRIQISPETAHGELVPGSSFPEWRAVQVQVTFSIQDVISIEKDFHNIIRTVNLHMGIK